MWIVLIIKDATRLSVLHNMLEGMKSLVSSSREAGLTADAGATPYPCAHCHKSFMRSDVRAKHMQTMHGIGGSGSAKRERTSSTASDTPPT
jgi:hypothetical protein